MMSLDGELTWHRPLGEDAIGAQGGDLCVGAASSYRPLRDTPAMHRELASLDGSVESLLAFALAHGPLWTMPDASFCCIEPISGWADRSAWMADATILWDLASGHEPIPAEVARERDGLAMVRDPNGRWREVDPGRCPAGDRLRIGVYAVACNVVAEAMAPFMVPRFAPGPDGARWVVRLPTLWAACVWQLAREMGGDLAFRRCAACGKWIEETSAMKPTPRDSTTCSSACRQRLYRMRKAA